MRPGEILRRFWDLVADRRYDDAVALLDPAGTFFSRPIGTVPMEAFIYIMRAVQGSAPMTFSFQTEMENGNSAMMEMEGFGTFPSGELYNNNYVWVAEVRDGLIHNLREYSDSAYSGEVFGRNLAPEIQQTFGEIIAKAQAN